MWDFVMDKSGAGAGFLRVLRFPLPIYIPSASPHTPEFKKIKKKKRPLHAHIGQHKLKQTSMPPVVFEPTIPVFE
jgi:hypothetical protein